MITFREKGHLYESIDPSEKIDWVSVTSLVSQFKKPFDAVAQASKSSANKKSKWFGIPPEEIQAIWKSEAKRADSTGTWYHAQRESDLLALDSITREGVLLPIIRPLTNGEIKEAPDQTLVEGIYPEHFVYLKSAGLCGQADRVEVVNGKVNISDYKTNKEMKTQGYKNWEGIVSAMSDPIAHLDDCHLIHYTLQLSMYMYIILKHNYNLKPGKMTLDHVSFEIESKDKYGMPIHKLVNGEPIVKEVKQYIIPYMKSEVISIIKWLNENRDKLRPKQ